MGIETKETVEHIYDTDLIAEAVYYIEQGFRSRDAKEQNSREVISRIVETADTVLSTVQKRATTTQTDIKATEEEAREYFGEEFIQQFEDIRRRLTEQGMTLYIHGTTIDVAENAMENGFEARNPSITSTAVIQQSYEDVPEYQEFSKFMNWPHKDYKGFVLVAVPNECRDRENPMPLWEYRPVPEGTELTDSTRQFAIKPEFIVGTVDATEKTIKENPMYTDVHSYDGLLLDDSVARPEKQSTVEKVEKKDSIIEDIENESIYTEEEIQPQEVSLADEIDSLIETIRDFYGNILALKEAGGQIVEIGSDEQSYLSNVSAESIDRYKEDVQRAITRLKQIIPELKTMDIDDKQIDDFISDVRMSEFSNFTEKIKMFQRDKEKGKAVEWGEEEMTDGIDRDDWD